MEDACVAGPDAVAELMSRSRAAVAGDEKKDKGITEHFDPTRQRYRVRIAKSGERVNVKPCNMTFLPSLHASATAVAADAAAAAAAHPSPPCSPPADDAPADGAAGNASSSSPPRPRRSGAGQRSQRLEAGPAPSPRDLWRQVRAEDGHGQPGGEGGGSVAGEAVLDGQNQVRVMLIDTGRGCEGTGITVRIVGLHVTNGYAVRAQEPSRRWQLVACAISGGGLNRRCVMRCAPRLFAALRRYTLLPWVTYIYPLPLNCCRRAAPSPTPPPLRSAAPRRHASSRPRAAHRLIAANRRLHLQLARAPAMLAAYLALA